MISTAKNPMHHGRSPARRIRSAWKRLAFVALVWVAALPGAQAAQGIPKEVQAVIDKRKIPEDAVSMVVQEIDSVSPVLWVNPTVARNPASSLKLLTTFVALDVLGPNYTWRTKLIADGPIKNGVLDGDLVMKGYGDPYLVEEELWKLLGELSNRGINQITGDLVIDNNHFDIPDADPGAFDQQPFRLYNVLPVATLVNFKATEFQFFPRGDGKNVRIRVHPKLSNLTVRNQLRQVPGPCRGYHRGIHMHVPDPLLGDKVIFSGSFPSGCRSYSLHRSVLQHDTYAFGTFKRLWSHWGGTINGGVRIGTAPKKRALVTWHSRPLAEVIRHVNKWSNNVMTRMLLYTLALSKYDPPVTREQGIEVIHAHLKEHQLDDSRLVIDNGSGLSRISRIDAGLMNDLLRFAYRDPFMPEFIASLSINGIDGTTRKRFRGRKQAGRMHLKTGRLDGVAAIAGYVVAQSGKTYTVVLLVNHKSIHQGPGIELQNALLNWVYSQ